MKSMSCMLVRWFLVSNKVIMELVGVDELLKQIEELGRKGASVENKALKQAGEFIADETRKEVPVDTGNLRDSIEVSHIKRGENAKYVHVYTDLPYGWMLEFGTWKMNANPFMGRAYASNYWKAQKIIMNELRKGLGL